MFKLRQANGVPRLFLFSANDSKVSPPVGLCFGLGGRWGGVLCRP